MLPPWLASLVILVHIGHAMAFGAPAQVPLGVAPTSPALIGPFGEQQPIGSRSRTAITPEISAYAEGLLKARQVPGLSVGIVRVDGDSIVTEFGAWGNMTEDGNATKPEVRSTVLYILVSQPHAYI